MVRRSIVFFNCYTCINNQFNFRAVAIYPKGDRISANDSVGVFFHLLNNRPNYASYKISIVDGLGTERYTRSTDQVFEKIKPGWGWPRFISRNDLFANKKRLIKDNTLTLNGTFEFINESKFVLEKGKSIENCRRDHLFNKRFFTDLEIKVQGRSIRTHKLLLASSSPVLGERLFNLAETQNAVHEVSDETRQNKKRAGSDLDKNANILEIDDLEFEVAEEMIDFIYDGEVEDMEKYAKPLLEAAEEFKMAHLKIYCEKYLFEKLCIENAIETLKLSAKCHAEELKKECIDFIRK